MPLFCDLPFSIVGVIILITGKLRVTGSRRIYGGIYGNQARLIGLLLLIPTLIALYWLLSPVRTTPQSTSVTTIYLLSLVILPLLAAIVVLMSPESSGGRKGAQQEIFTLPEAARYLKIPEQEVLQLIRSGELRARQIGNEYRIHRDRLDEIPQEWLHLGG